MKRCEYGHYYDDSKHTSCPACGIPDLDIGKTVPKKSTWPEPEDVGKTRRSVDSEHTRQKDRRGESNIDAGVTVAKVRKELDIDPVVGWLVCVKGPDRGRDYRIRSEKNFIGRSDRHITRMLYEYHTEGGTLQWVAQTCPEMASISRSIDDALGEGAKACYIHGGVMDNLLARGELKEIPGLIQKIRDAGLPAGIAGHNPKVFEWAEDHLDVDFYMCSYYNSASRDQEAEMRTGRPEWFVDGDRDIMVKLIQKLKHPAIHYKILAAGRKSPREAFEFAARHLRPGDAVCIGIYPEHKPEMLVEDAALFTKYAGGK
jgi:hypothetical protein